ncbi:MAG: hypothetical protein CH6_3617 [Candidatus Kapaibacterium sp.]|nr:MAG: hypothetical protein CH6_3617 [Candidatus Kapabacteria bacterium]
MDKNILVIEDDVTSCLLIKQVLGKANFFVDIAKDSIEGWEKATQKKYDLFIVDLNLPFGENGFEFVSRIRTNSQYKNTPIVAITAYIGIFDKDECLKKGFNYYVAKPFDIKYFANLVKDIFQQK